MLKEANQLNPFGQQCRSRPPELPTGALCDISRATADGGAKRAEADAAEVPTGRHRPAQPTAIKSNRSNRAPR